MAQEQLTDQNFYNDNAETYCQATVKVDMGDARERFLRMLQPGARILDAGCGSGRDMRAFMLRGFLVSGFDASPQMASYASSYSGRTCEVLLEQVCQGTREALGILFRRHARTVRNVAYRILKNEAEADDLVQEVFIFICRKAVRHNFQGGLSWDLPQTRSNKILESLLDRWSIDGRLLTRTAFPVTLNGSYLTDPVTGSQYYGNLNLVPNQPTYLYGSQYPGGKAINSAAFTLPPGSAIGDAPRNFVRGFGLAQINVAARREFKLHDQIAPQFRAEEFNLLNHPNFGYVDPLFTDATFGQATKMLNTSLTTVASQYQQGGSRSMQFALKLLF